MSKLEYREKRNGEKETHFVYGIGHCIEQTDSSGPRYPKSRVRKRGEIELYYQIYRASLVLSTILCMIGYTEYYTAWQTLVQLVHTNWYYPVCPVLIKCH